MTLLPQAHQNKHPAGSPSLNSHHQQGVPLWAVRGADFGDGLHGAAQVSVLVLGLCLSVGLARGGVEAEGGQRVVGSGRRLMRCCALLDAWTVALAQHKHTHADNNKKHHPSIHRTNARAQRRTWLYRIRPSVTHEPFHPLNFPAEKLTADFSAGVVTPNQLRWRPFAIPSEPSVDFVRGLLTVCGAGRCVFCCCCWWRFVQPQRLALHTTHSHSPATHNPPRLPPFNNTKKTRARNSAAAKTGFAIHVYAATASMADACLANADGEMLIVPQQGACGAARALLVCCLFVLLLFSYG